MVGLERTSKNNIPGQHKVFRKCVKRHKATALVRPIDAYYYLININNEDISSEEQRP